MKYFWLILLVFVLFPGAAAGQTCQLKVNQAYKTLESSSVYFVSSDCKKRAFKNEAVYFSYFDSWDQVRIADRSRIEFIKNHPLKFLPWGPKKEFRNGSLIKTPEKSDVYFIVQGIAHKVESGDALVDLGLSFEMIEDVDDRVLASMMKGESIGVGKPPAGMVFRYADSPQIYRLVEKRGGTNEKHHIKTMDELEAISRVDRIAIFDRNKQFLTYSGVVQSPHVDQKSDVVGSFNKKDKAVFDFIVALREQLDRYKNDIGHFPYGGIDNLYLGENVHCLDTRGFQYNCLGSDKVYMASFDVPLGSRIEYLPGGEDNYYVKFALAFDLGSYKAGIYQATSKGIELQVQKGKYGFTRDFYTIKCDDYKDKELDFNYRYQLALCESKKAKIAYGYEVFVEKIYSDSVSLLITNLRDADPFLRRVIVKKDESAAVRLRSFGVSESHITAYFTYAGFETVNRTYAAKLKVGYQRVLPLEGDEVDLDRKCSIEQGYHVLKTGILKLCNFNQVLDPNGHFHIDVIGSQSFGAQELSIEVFGVVNDNTAFLDNPRGGRAYEYGSKSTKLKLHMVHTFYTTKVVNGKVYLQTVVITPKEIANGGRSNAYAVLDVHVSEQLVNTSNVINDEYAARTKPFCIARDVEEELSEQMEIALCPNAKFKQVGGNILISYPKSLGNNKSIELFIRGTHELAWSGETVYLVPGESIDLSTSASGMDSYDIELTYKKAGEKRNEIILSIDAQVNE